MEWQDTRLQMTARSDSAQRSEGRKQNRMPVSAEGGDFEVRSGATLNAGLMRLPPTEGRGVLELTWFIRS